MHALTRDADCDRSIDSGVDAATIGLRPFGDPPDRTILDHIADGICFVDRERTITYWNPGAERITGYAASAVIGRPCHSNLMSHVDDAGTPSCDTRCPLAATIADGNSREAEVWLRHRDGRRLPVRVRTAAVVDGAGAIVGAVEVFDDATGTSGTTTPARDDPGDVARGDSLIDALTGIPNRRHLDAELAGRLEDLQRYGWPFGLLLADVDHLAQINERGREAGDVVLRTVAATLSGAVRAGDLVGRWDGDAFAIIGGGSAGHALRDTAERLRSLVAQSVVRCADAELSIRISLGGAIAVASDSPRSFQERAGRALRSAKAAGRDRVVIADPQDADVVDSTPSPPLPPASVDSLLAGRPAALL